MSKKEVVMGQLEWHHKFRLPRRSFRLGVVSPGSYTPALFWKGSTLVFNTKMFALKGSAAIAVLIVHRDRKKRSKSALNNVLQQNRRRRYHVTACDGNRQVKHVKDVDYSLCYIIPSTPSAKMCL